MRQFVYISTAVGLDKGEVEQIVSVSQRNNAGQHVTGLLTYNGRNFLQVLEGDEDHLLLLMAKLGRDPRHSGITRLVDQAIVERQCPDWHMAWIPLAKTTAARREALKTQLPLTLEANVQELIGNFAALN